jgi:hypothetical protein
MNENQRTLQEQTFGENPNDIRYTSVTVSAADIVRNSNAYRVNVQGTRWLIRSDFPVVVYADNVPIALVGPYAPEPGAVATWRHAGPVLRLKRNVKQFMFALVGGFGGGGGTEAYRMHGVCVVEGAPGTQIEPLPVDPDLLPVHTFGPFFAGIGAGVAPPGLFDVSEASWAQNFSSVLPKEIWIKSITVNRVLVSGAPSASALYRLELSKKNVPAGDNDIIVAVGENSSCWCVPLHNVKVPLYSMYSKWAAEVPIMEFNMSYAVDAAATTALIYVTASYRF